MKRKVDEGPAALPSATPAPPWPERRRPETLRLRSFTPSFTVTDLARSVDFYAGTLGFVVAERWTEEGELVGVMLRAGLCELSLVQDDWAQVRDRPRGGSSGRGVRRHHETGQPAYTQRRFPGRPMVPSQASPAAPARCALRRAIVRP